MEDFIEKIKITVNPNFVCTMNCTYHKFREIKEDKVSLLQLDQGIEIIKGLLKKPIKRIEIHFNSCDVMLEWGNLLKPFIQSHPDYFFSIHSNGLLLFPDRLDFIKEHNIALQVSLDGPKHIQDINRLSKNGKSTYDIVYNTIQEIKKRDIPLTIVSTFNSQSVQYIVEVFQYHIAENNNFRFLFDTTNSNYLDCYEKLDKWFIEIAQLYNTLSEDKKKLFKDMSSALNIFNRKPNLFFTLNAYSLKVKKHRHSFKEFAQWDLTNNQWIINDYSVSEEDAILTPVCGCNTDFCKKCPIYHGKLYEQNHYNYSLYCRLFRALLKEQSLI